MPSHMAAYEVQLKLTQLHWVYIEENKYMLCTYYMKEIQVDNDELMGQEEWMKCILYPQGVYILGGEKSCIHIHTRYTFLRIVEAHST